jgi:hypothetical protein
VIFRAAQSEPVLVDPVAVLPDITVTAGGDVVLADSGRARTLRLPVLSVSRLVEIASAARTTTDDSAPAATLLRWDGSALRQVAMSPSDGVALLAELRGALGSAPQSDYVPPDVVVVATAGGGGIPTPWPLSDLAAGAALAGSRCIIYHDADAATVRRIAIDPTRAYVSNTVSYAVVTRPLLPFEHDCTDLR